MVNKSQPIALPWFSKIVAATIQFVNIFLWLISPMALLLLIVAFIMFLDYHGAHQRLGRALDEVPLTATAMVTACYPEERYCFADFRDAREKNRYGKLDWRYYPESISTRLASLERGDTIVVRYTRDPYLSDIILADHYRAFSNYKGYAYEMGGIALVSWLILALHPEVMLFALVDDMGSLVEQKWNRMIGGLR